VAAEVMERARLLLEHTAARLIVVGGAIPAAEDVETLFASKALVIDACRHVVRDETQGGVAATRPVSVHAARALGEACPEDVPRDTLVAARSRLN